MTSPPEWLDLALEEYRAHRAEVISTIQNQQTSLTVGTAAVGILAAGAFNRWEEQFVATVVFLFVLPVIAALVLLIWFSQVDGMFNVGRYLNKLEAELRKGYSDAPAILMTWEKSIRESASKERFAPRLWQNYAIVSLYVLLAQASIVLGAYRGYDQRPVLVPIGAVVESVLLVLLAVLLVRGLVHGRRV